MALYAIDDKTPQLVSNVWIADSAQVIGDVTMESQSSVWFGAIVLADNEPMTIGAGSNVQESAVLHSDPGFPLTI